MVEQHSDGDGCDTMVSRIAKLDSDVEHVESETGEIK